jgi:hypothetical protein
LEALISAQITTLLDELEAQAVEYYVIDEGGYEASKSPTIAVPTSAIHQLRQELNGEGVDE